ncbi:MAG: ribonuclease Z [bacterium]|nr:ribonuclease Z [bacterium]
MFEVVFLGTSASAPSIYRGLPSLAVFGGEHRFLVDCGEGTQRQILRSGIGFKKLNKILLTHGHLDHILGLGGLISTFARWENEGIEQIDIFGGRATLDRVHALLYGVVLQYEQLPIEIKLLELAPGVIFQAKEYDVRAFPVTHRGYGNFGFSFEEHTRRPFLADQAEALGVPAGPERGKLVGGQAVTLADGRTITPEMVLGAAVRGVRLVVIGDVARTDNLVEHVSGADVLVIESTFLHEDADAARAFGHITAKQAAQLADQCGVGALLITHVSRRYREADVLDEARKVFPNTFVARDLDHFQVRRDPPAIKVAPEKRDKTPAEPAADTSPISETTAGVSEKTPPADQTSTE